MRAFLFCLFLIVFAYCLVMKIWDELTKICGDESLFAQRCFSVYGKSLVVIQGFKRIVSINSGQMSFEFGNGFLSLFGQNLVVKKIVSGFAVVQGQIEKVEF